MERARWDDVLRSVVDSGRVPGARALCTIVAIGLLLALAPATGARPGAATKVTFTRTLPTRVHLRHGHHSRLSAHGLRASTHHARAAIVGGSQISIEQAPWQVVVVAFLSTEEALLCGGSILDESHVLTAGHCMFNPNTRARVPAEQILVIAGTSDIEVIEAEEQLSFTSAVRVHPYYSYDPEATQATADDVAVVELEKPLVYKSTAKPIEPVPAGGPYMEAGTAVRLTGFGAQSPTELNGRLYAISMTLGFSRQCGDEADALFLCANTPGGSVCLGDSGSGLTLPGSPAQLIGVADTVQVIEGQPCRDGAEGGFANVAAPEIHDFIEGDEAPPRAPRGGGAVIRGITTVGYSLTCEPGSWSNSPTFTYMFINSSSGQILQQGASPTYPLSTVDVGRTILCEVHAANSGGTGVGRTPALPAIKAAPVPPPPPPVLPPPTISTPPPASNVTIFPPAEAAEAGGVLLTATNIKVKSSGTALVELECLGTANCHGKLTLTAKSTVKAKGKKRTRTTTIGAVNYSIPGDEAKTVKVKLDVAGRSLLGTGHGHLSARLTILELAPNAAQTQSKSVRLLLQTRSTPRMKNK